LASMKRFPTKEGNVCDVCQKKTHDKARRKIYEAHREIHLETSYQQQKQLYAKMSQIPPLIRKDCFTPQWYADMFEIERSFTKSECYTKVKEELKRVMKLAYYKHPKKMIDKYKRYYQIKPGIKFMVDGE
jgi:wobble nucleotide-excising tRNase